MRPRFHRLALQEYIEAIEWYAKRSEFAPHRFIDQVQAALAAIEERPRSFPLIAGITRRARVRRFPYSIVFDFKPTEIVIIAVAHAKRKESFWRFRSQRP